MSEIKKRLHPLAPGFGFEAVTRLPDHKRFTDWYARTKRIG